ncbi:hypothetical protein B0H16DRAFT_1483383 [Mycena metata]|uniref:Uncharacterized protein n=1 Tax=Mycena metata TaxID=1033252 RepID=A0AAD7DZU8_9AGAR|nr:hypothetical protein B0H16DRAFT_1483383 [Mycena metata]
MKEKVGHAQHAATLRYRERNKSELQRKARERMAKRRTQLKKSSEAWRSIAKRGFKEWHEGYLKRHPIQPRPAEEEELPEWPSSDSERGESPNDPDDGGAPAIPPPPPESAPYDDHLNYFLDYQDPTTAADYVPKPGQQPYFQRGKRRWN